MQREITSPTRLLDKNGNVAVPGYCKKNYYIYRRKDIQAPAIRIKEWDFYQISDPRYTLQMTFADISMGGAGSFCLFDRTTGEKKETAKVSLLTMGRMALPENTSQPHTIVVQNKNFLMRVQATEEKRVFHAAGKLGKEDFVCDLTLFVQKDAESLTMAVPFKQNGHFYLNQKWNCMPAEGTICIGNREIHLNPSDAFGVLDWGRGVWPYHEDWYWGNGSTRLPDGKLFGFEIGWGFGDMSAASENMLFYDGKAHKIGAVSLEHDENDPMKPWIFRSDDRRFQFTMRPEYDNYTSSRVLGLVGNRCHQVFGKWSGQAVLDDGTVLTIDRMTAFCEHSDNRW